jgi:outer membrane biosynthesis protein TonB
MKKFFLFAIAICILFLAVIAHAQPKPGDQSATGFIIFLKESPPPDDPSSWFVIFPTTISAQAILAAGYHPFQFENSAGAATLSMVKLLVNRWPQVCHKGKLKFVNQETKQTLFVDEFATKPFGFTYQGPPMCGWQASALQGHPIVVPVMGTVSVTLTIPPTITGLSAIGVNPAPQPPPPRPPVNPPQGQTPPQNTQPPPQNTPPGGGGPTQPVQVDPTQEVQVDPRIVGPEPQPIPKDDTEGTYAEGNDEPPAPPPNPNEGNTTSNQTSENQSGGNTTTDQTSGNENESTSAPPPMQGRQKRDCAAIVTTCDAYANVGIDQYNENISLGCGYEQKDPNRWHNTYRNHFKWCDQMVGVETAISGCEGREQELDQCVANK